MNTIFYIVIGVYILAINFYGILMLKYQKKHVVDKEYKYPKVTDGRLIFSALLGGAIGIFSFMFIFKYKTKNILLMILLPIIIAINIYLLIMVFRTGNYYMK